MRKWGYIFGAVLLLTIGTPVMGQEGEGEEEQDFRTEAEKKADREAAKYWDSLEEDDEDEKKGFNAGILVGALFSHDYSSHLYNGYGFDRTGQPNSWSDAWLNRWINEILRNPAQGDQVAQQLNINPGEWTFNESDMPRDMTYNIAFAFGLQGRYNFNNKNALLFNINFAQLTLNGQFTIVLDNTQVSDPTDSGDSNNPDNIRRFGIRGEEQRVMLQFGYQRILGSHDLLNWVVEAGVDLTFAKFNGNQAEIGSEVIDLTTFYNNLGYQTESARNLTGVAPGLFGGAGVQLDIGGKWTVQLLYNPVYQKIALGTDTKYGLHHTLGLRAIYNI